MTHKCTAHKHANTAHSYAYARARARAYPPCSPRRLTLRRVQVTTGDGWYDMIYDAAVAPPFCTNEVVAVATHEQ